MNCHVINKGELYMFTESQRECYEVHDRDADCFLDAAICMAESKGVELSDVLETYKILELARQNTLYCRNGEYFDGQMEGMSEQIDKLADAIRDLD